MHYRDYYRHIRAIGTFRAAEALNLAKAAAELDDRAEQRARPAWVEVNKETWPDGSSFRLSQSIRVF